MVDLDAVVSRLPVVGHPAHGKAGRSPEIRGCHADRAFGDVYHAVIAAILIVC
jgi:hypothetical protein